ncbi:hypothetical protein H4Q26_015823 [Puccinia striiformis f. sp. tritici PST-130]|nr:hypothetical protein H4Q26_015823 [Puccinia striiformis f. sp. tritici PST-130]
MTSIKKEQARYLQRITSKSLVEGHAWPPSSEDQPSINQMIFNLMTHILTKFKDASSEVDQHAAVEKNSTFMYLDSLIAKKVHVYKKPSAAIDGSINAPTQSNQPKRSTKQLSNFQLSREADDNDNDDERIQNDLNHPFPSKIEITVFDTALPNNQLQHGNQHA